MPIAPEYTSTPRKTYLFGTPLKRSYAPFLHNTITRLSGVPYHYAKYESSDIEAFLKLVHEPECGGSAVTMPNKVAICAHCDDLTEDGRLIGACNTIILRKGPNGERQLVGHNTDSVGVLESLKKADEGFYTTVKEGKSRPGMIFGAGGASRAAVYAMNRWMNCNPIYVANRDDREVEDLIADYKKNASPAFSPTMIHIKDPKQVEELEAPAYIVSAVPAFPPVTPGELNARAIIEAIFAKSDKGVILEMCYFPHPWTELAQIAQDQSWNVVTGEQAMIWQGVEQEKLWLNCEESDLPMKEIFDIVKQQLADDAKSGQEPPEQ